MILLVQTLTCTGCDVRVCHDDPVRLLTHQKLEISTESGPKTRPDPDRTISVRRA